MPEVKTRDRVAVSDDRDRAQDAFDCDVSQLHGLFLPLTVKTLGGPET
jgi:hypothetical protein